MERISERFLIPVLKAIIETFPFAIHGFHAENGSEYINHRVAKLLNKLNIEFTKSRPRRSSWRNASAGAGAGLLQAIIAWRVLFLAMLGRDCPEMPCDTVFADEEWKAVYLVTQRKPPPDEPPSLDTMVRMVAGLGGFLNRKRDAFPEPKTLWIGLQRAANFVLALDAQRSIGESCG